jgi:glycosyltransferase involved in cell wall biosynthesis
MWQNQTVAVILPTYNEADSIAACVAKFAALGR